MDDLQKHQHQQRLEAERRLRTELEAAFRRAQQSQSRRARECWTEQDDYLVNAGYLAWLASENPR